LLSLMVIALILVTANAELIDPLDPSQLGESMSMPLYQDFIKDSKTTGVITESNSIHEFNSKQAGFSIVPMPETDPDNALKNVNVTGSWTFDLKGKNQDQMKLFLIQNENMIIGQGTINGGNQTRNATACGSVFGETLSLNVMPVGVFNLYKLNLSLSDLDAGIYTFYAADGSSWSGGVAFAVSSNIFKSAELENSDAENSILSYNQDG
jgi:hypothetical protein